MDGTQPNGTKLVTTKDLQLLSLSQAQADFLEDSFHKTGLAQLETEQILMLSSSPLTTWLDLTWRTQMMELLSTQFLVKVQLSDLEMIS